VEKVQNYYLIYQILYKDGILKKDVSE